MSMALKLVRAAFSASERIAPAAAGRVAFELFCRTPNPASLTPGEKRAVDNAADFMADARHHRIEAAGATVAVHEFRPSGQPLGKVLVVHGWRSRTEFMRTIVEELTTAGYQVFSLDLPGHGASTSRKLDMKRAVQAVSAAANWFGPFFAMVGHSFGGAVVVNAATGSVKDIPAVATARLVTIASPSVINRVFEGFGDFVGLGPRSQKAMNDRVEPIAGRPLSDFQTGKLLKRVPIETLVIHAHDDREVGPEHADLASKAGPHVQLEWHDGLGHRRIIADKGVARSVVRFVGAPMAAKLAA